MAQQTRSRGCKQHPVCGMLASRLHTADRHETMNYDKTSAKHFGKRGSSWATLCYATTRWPLIVS
jgi:hypothetical protein